MQLFAQSDFDKSKDVENGAVVYKGQFTFEDMLQEESFGWLQRGATSYKPDSVTMVYLKKHLPDYQLVVLLGTWCEDSHVLIPKLYSTLQQAGYPMNNYKMYGLNRAKESKYIEHKLYKAEKVPTVIIVKNNMEVGRITESVRKSIEKDLAAMIEKHIDEQR